MREAPYLSTVGQQTTTLNGLLNHTINSIHSFTRVYPFGCKTIKDDVA